MDTTHTGTPRTETTTADAPDASVRVWDPLVRIVHWSLVVAFATAWFTAEESETLHNWAGYTVAGLVGLRLVWGLIGTRNARFVHFVRGPRAVLAYLGGLVSGTSRRHLGHNPAGAAMVIALLLALIGTTLSGMALLAVEEGEGPLASWLAPAVSLPANAPAAGYEREADHGEHEEEDGEDEGSEELLEEVHEVFANATLLLVILHVLGVLASGLAHRENLVRAMVTGRKRADS
jgi:cytochrome b